MVKIVAAEASRPGLKRWLGEETLVKTMKTNSVRAWSAHLEQLRVGYEGGLLKDDTGNHFFLAMQVRDLPDIYKHRITTGSMRAAVQSNDVVTVIKKYICDEQLSQPPLLTLTHARFSRLDTMVPRAKQPLRECTAAKQAWLETARLVVRAYGPAYEVSAQYLRDLCADVFYNTSVPPPLPWHMGSLLAFSCFGSERAWIPVISWATKEIMALQRSRRAPCNFQTA
ncbi:unnamed protein product [Symbiodinium natans]|uniref:Uncharacterized protein n=1 Tax=Symbiodinium natans TaxID=878477 RepID=A0A812I132_9DINO|nr:unnamed protein product [Symbiodinium natans]